MVLLTKLVFEIIDVEVFLRIKNRNKNTVGKSDLIWEVTLLQVICTVEYDLGLSQGDCNCEVFLLAR